PRRPCVPDRGARLGRLRQPSTAVAQTTRAALRIPADAPPRAIPAARSRARVADVTRNRRGRAPPGAPAVADRGAPPRRRRDSGRPPPGDLPRGSGLDAGRGNRIPRNRRGVPGLWVRPRAIPAD